jgi:ABC-type Fe3+ transport system permease subunit
MSESAEEPQHGTHPALKVAAPLIVLAATWASNKVIAMGYSAITGKEPPNPDDRRVSLARALTWTIATAATAAVIQMVIYRAVSSGSDDD